MMKRTGVTRLGPDEAPHPPQQAPVTMQQPGASNMHTLAQSAQPQILGAAAMLSVSGAVSGVQTLSNFGRTTPRPPTPAVINYLKPTTVQYAAKTAPPMQMPRHKPIGSPSPSPVVQPPSQGAPIQGGTPPPAAGFQRLKVEDALSYLDQVKFKFNTQPQVYNDFLDIMKEFKSQTIDTPGVITRVSTLFKGHPELIVGFNTFLPPGYKIEVQSNGQVSVSMPSPTALGASGVILGVHHAPPQPPLVHLLPVPQSVTTAIVHNLPVNPVTAPVTNTLHHISQAHQQIEAAAIQQQQTQQHLASGGTVPPPGNAAQNPTPPGQPVEFNHAIEYVNKIKSRFSRQPDKYKRFLEILHAYQRGHRDIKQPQAKLQTEQEVYSQVAKLFENQEDLLAEFGQFLPDAKAVAGKHAYSPPHHHQVDEPTGYQSGPPVASPPHPSHHVPIAPQIQKHAPIPSSVPTQPPPHHHLKRSPSFSSAATMNLSAPPPKKSRPSVLTGAAVRDVTHAEAAKYGTMQEYNYFDRVRRALRTQDVYDNFLRCLLLYTNEIISSSELLCVTAPFLCRHPELQRWLQHFVTPASPSRVSSDNEHSGVRRAYNESSYEPNTNSLLSYDKERMEKAALRYEPISNMAAQIRFDRPTGDAAMDIDLSTCKRLGTSYCALPKHSAEAASRKCSGRTALCKEVLNDTWVSFPTWSEDSTFVSSRKTQYEEYIYRCEDERFELDVVIETNASTIRVLEGVQKKLSRMTAEDASKYRLDECLGGHSPTIHQRALRRIYGEKAIDIIAGLKKNPAVAVPVVLRRLKAKEEEWREAQKGFNKQWREQNEKYYLKSLDHQGIHFKQNDLKALRSKSLFNEVEALYQAGKTGPHVCVDFGVKNRQEAIKIVRDASELLIHHARRQTAIQKAEKRRIKQLLRQFIPDLFNHPRLPMSDDENDEEKDDAPSPASGDEDMKSDTVKQEKEQSSESDNNSEKCTKNNKNNKENTPKNNNTEHKENAYNNVKRSNSNEESVKSDTRQDTDDDYKDHPLNESTFVCTSSWYLFLRLHGVLCERLCGAKHTSHSLAAGHDADAAAALRLRPNNLPVEVSSPAEYYPALLELVRGVLDGNTEPSAYEDAAREMLGIKAYPAYTLDKLVSYAVRQLQHCVSEQWSIQASDLAARASSRCSSGYVRRALKVLRPHATFLYTVHSGDECKVTFELLEPAGEGRSSPQLNNDSRLSPAEPLPMQNKPVFLPRAARKCGAPATSAVARPTARVSRPLPQARARRKPGNERPQRTLYRTHLASRPLLVYNKGSLRSARQNHERLHEARRAAFRAWLRRHTSDRALAT